MPSIMLLVSTPLLKPAPRAPSAPDARFCLVYRFPRPFLAPTHCRRRGLRSSTPLDALDWSLFPSAPELPPLAVACERRAAAITPV